MRARAGAVFFLSVCLASCTAPGVVPPQVAPPPPATAPVEAGTRTGDGDFILRGDMAQGGVMRGTVPDRTLRLTFDGADVPVAPDGLFLIAFDRDAGPEAILAAELAGGGRIERRLAVAPGDWKLQHVNADYRAGVSPEEFVRRRAVELERIAAARRVRTGSEGWRQGFRWPLEGRLSGVFGSQRIYRGKPGSYHGGMDIVAPAGTPFVAPADGVVVLAATEPFTLEGNLLMIDHGMGLNSAFLHCASLAVSEGDVVRQGQVIGTVGSSGRATGPHLHWGMSWNAARVDPGRLAGPMPQK